jgi:LysM repeat protein
MTNSNKTTKTVLGAIAATGLLAIGGVASADETKTYEVQSGDTLNKIAEKAYGEKSAKSGVKAIVSQNQLDDSNHIVAGQELVLPTLKAEKVKYHTVKAGEFLYQIAEDNDVEIADLLYWNDLTLSSVIHPKQKLQVSGDKAPADFNVNGVAQAQTITAAPAQPAAPAYTAPAAPVQQAPAQPAVPVQSQQASATGDAALDIIIGRESSHNTNARNGQYYGLGQLSVAAQAQYGGGPGTTYAQQYAAAKSYAVDRYGSTEAALAFWNANGWY